MAQTTISIRIDEDLKKEMEETCKELGLNITTAFIMFAKKVSREHRIPFEVSIDPFYSASNIKSIDESIEQMNRGKIVVKTMEELDKVDKLDQNSLEMSLPKYLKDDIDALMKGYENNSTLLDCLYSEVQGSINSALYGNEINEKEAIFLRGKYLGLEG